MLAVNDMLKDEITKLNYNLVPPGCHGDVRTVRMIQESLGRLIDSLGKQSADAQGLTKIITTAEKLQNAPTHTVYVLKDPAGNNGNGELVGFLKVAYKNLYMFDERNQVVQMEPLCVLDFYVNSSRQRHGYGKKLFDYMLQDTGSRPEKIAVDGPSSKMEGFLAKNYGIQSLTKQSNNFAVSPAFFLNSGDVQSGPSTPMVPAAAVGRFAARKPQSSIGDIIHGAPSDRVHVETHTNNGTPDGWDTPQPKLPSPEPEPEPEPETVPEPAPASPSPERPTTLSVAPVASGERSPAGSTTPRRISQLTEQGYFDVKYYHNKLW